MKTELITVVILAIGVLAGAAVLEPSGWIAVAIIALGTLRVGRSRAEYGRAFADGRSAMRRRSEYRESD